MKSVRVRIKFGKPVKDNEGQVLILLLVFIAMVSLIVTPLLTYINTSLKTGQTFQSKTDELYAAEAGIKDAMWQIKYGNIKTFTDPVVYNPYDYTDSWTYMLSDQINAKSTNVAIENVWIPKNIPAPSQSQASAIIQTGKLIVTGSASGTSTYQIKIDYYEEETDPPLQVKTLGVWLPPGYNYVAGSSNLESDTTAPYYPSSVNTTTWDSGQAVIWTFQPGTLFLGSQGPPVVSPFPGVDTTAVPVTSTITFSFTSQQPGKLPDAISWITTEGVSDIPFSWDADTKIFHINSIAGSTQVDTYIVKNELRQLQSALAGDYYATGNSNLSAPAGSKYRTQWNDPSSAKISSANIPADADVTAAYLYWTGWKSSNTPQPDTSVVFKIDNGDGSGPEQVYLDSNGQPQQGNQELTATRSQVFQNYSGSSPHGFSYSSFCDVTQLVRKYSQAPIAPNTNWPGYATYWVGGIDADASPQDEWAYACWSLVIIYTSPQTQGHQLYLYDKFTNSNQNTQNGVDVDFDGDGQPGGNISGFIVPQPVAGEVNAGKITTFAGEGDVWYTGDYLALNGTKLWDGINCTDNSKDNPDNIFNSTSLGLNTNDGIDVDTLGIDPTSGQYITWASSLLKPGDTSAHIDLVTHTDVWNLVYIIISFRSVTTTGGNISYNIKG